MKLLASLFCEDIRKEVGNKSSLMGIFNDKIEIIFSNSAAEAWPIKMNIGLYTRVSLEEEDSIPDMVQIIVKHNGNQILEVNGPIKNMDFSKPFNIEFMMKDLSIPSEGVIEPQLTFKIGTTEVQRISTSVIKIIKKA